MVALRMAQALAAVLAAAAVVPAQALAQAAADSGYIDTDTVRIRGNSFSGPQVAGIAALILSEHPP
jgi:subtilisin family serine protease